MIRKSRQSEAARSGAVLLMVLVVIVLLTLAAYQFSDLMVAEYQASANYHQAAQSRACADAGIHYATALLSDPDAFSTQLGGNPFDNATVFGLQQIASGDKASPPGYFTLVAPPDPSNPNASSSFRNGVIDEGGKININAVMKRDPSGQALYDMLLKLPNMTSDVAASIVDWVDADNETRPGGAENDYYSGLSPSRSCKNGPLDSIEELLLVKGVTAQLLFGDDANRNGIQDGQEASADRGWSAFLTIHSREQNMDAKGQPLVYLNQDKMDDLVNHLIGELGEDMTKFIVLYRQYGPATASGDQQSLGRSVFSMFIPLPKGPRGGKTQAGKLADYTPIMSRPAVKKLDSIFDLVGVQVSVPNKDPRKPATVYTSPLNDQGACRDLLPKLFEKATALEDSEIPARINVNTAPREVLETITDMTEADVNNILGQRPRYSPSEAVNAIHQTPAWLLTEAGVSVDTLRKLEKIVTTRTQVYRIQSWGYLEGSQARPSRVEAVIDTNGGRPRILAWRDMTELGGGIPGNAK